MKALSPLLATALLLAGCTFPFTDETGRRQTEPFEVTGLKIAQAQVSGPPPGIYMGSIEFPVCLYNPNNYDIMFQSGFEVYQHIGPERKNWRIVDQSSSGPRIWFANAGTSSALGMVHHIVYNETVEGGSTNYTIHVWHEIVSPESVPRWDRWFNVTFIPYTTQAFHQEGQECNR